MLTKTLTPRVQVKDADAGYVEAVFATLNVIDKDGDVILPGAIDDGSAVVISAFGHESWSGKLPVGKGTIHEDGDELVVKAQFFVDTTHGRDTFGTVKGLAEDDLGEWSFSLQEVVAAKGDWNGSRANLISKVGKIKEVSPVLVGAGVNTRTLVVKADGMKFAEHVEAVVAAAVELVDRAEEVVALRAAKGKDIGDDAAEALGGLSDLCDRLKSLLANESGTNDPTPPDDPGTPGIDADAEFLRFVALSHGATS